MRIRPDDPQKVVQVQVVYRLKGKTIAGTSHCLTVYESTPEEVFNVIENALRQAEKNVSAAR